MESNGSVVKIELRGDDGKAVARGVIPKVDPLAEVVLWSGRVFVASGQTIKEHQVYEECPSVILTSVSEE